MAKPWKPFFEETEAESREPTGRSDLDRGLLETVQDA
jgi:hypothetical protein